jgi:RecA/RadA recombinase
LGGGSTTLARAIALEAVKAKRWVAYIDAERTLAAQDWAALGRTRRFWVIRTKAPEQAAW